MGGFPSGRQGMGRGAGRGPGAVYRWKLAALDLYSSPPTSILDVSDEAVGSLGWFLVCIPDMSALFAPNVSATCSLE